MKKLRRYKYRLMYLMPEVPEGHEFYSDIPDLQNHTEMWEKECPYSINIRNVDIEFVEDTQNKS